VNGSPVNFEAITVLGNFLHFFENRSIWPRGTSATRNGHTIARQMPPHARFTSKSAGVGRNGLVQWQLADALEVPRLLPAVAVYTSA